MEAEDRLIKEARLRRPNELHKASPDDPKHPGCRQAQKVVAAANFVQKMERRLSLKKKPRKELYVLRYDVRCAFLHSRFYASVPEGRSTLSRLLARY